MLASDPQLMYTILILPSLFGLTLIGDGLNKVVNEEWGGLMSVIFGLLFIGMVIVAYFFFSPLISGQRI